MSYIAPEDNAEPEITGGYLLKVDVADFNETDFETPLGNPPDHPWNYDRGGRAGERAGAVCAKHAL